MTEMRIVRDLAKYSEADEPAHRWRAIIGNETVSELWVDVESGEIAQVETPPQHQGNGYATALYRQAATEIEIFHAPEGHRTSEGHRFAQSVGGPVIDRCTVDYCEACQTC